MVTQLGAVLTSGTPGLLQAHCSTEHTPGQSCGADLVPPLGAPSLLECHPEQAPVGGLLGCWERAGPSPQLCGSPQ